MQRELDDWAGPRQKLLVLEKDVPLGGFVKEPHDKGRGLIRPTVAFRYERSQISARLQTKGCCKANGLRTGPLHKAHFDLLLDDGRGHSRRWDELLDSFCCLTGAK